MWKVLRALTGGNLQTDRMPVASDPNARNEIKTLQMELAEREQQLATVKHELERLRQNQARILSDAVASALEKLFADAAAPITQLLVQVHLIEVQQKPVPANDVTRLARRMIRACQDAGLAVHGAVGDDVCFDPNLHQPLSADTSISSGAPATVRVPGVAFGGRILRKASVEASGR